MLMSGLLPHCVLLAMILSSFCFTVLMFGLILIIMILINYQYYYY